jgi:hypothetical protein
MTFGNSIRGYCVRHSRLLLLLAVLSVLLATQGVAAAADSGGFDVVFDPMNHDTKTGP